VLNVPFSCESGIGCASKQDQGCGGCLSEEVLGGGLDCPGVVVLCHKGDDGQSVDLKAYSGKKSV